MTTTLHLVRHATHSAVSHVLVGRASGYSLSEEGRAQAKSLARCLARESVIAVLSSPRERAMETARPIAQALGLPVRSSEGLDEADFGAWQGRSFAELSNDPAWTRWNRERASTRPPGGETMLELQSRIVAEAEALHAAWPTETFVLVSHAEPIRALLLHVLGWPLDDWHKIVVEPASVSTVAIGGWGSRVIQINQSALAGAMPA